MENMYGKMEEIMKEIGMKIACTDKAYISGKMEENMMEILIWTLNKDMANIFGYILYYNRLMDDNI